MTCHERFVQFKLNLDVPDDRDDDEGIWMGTCSECPRYIPTPWGSCENIDDSAFV